MPDRPARRRPEFYAAIEYLEEAQAEILRRAVEIEDDAVGRVISRAKRPG
jgi:hypothetical protein